MLDELSEIVNPERSTVSGPGLCSSIHSGSSSRTGENMISLTTIAADGYPTCSKTLRESFAGFSSPSTVMRHVKQCSPGGKGGMRSTTSNESFGVSEGARVCARTPLS